MMKKLMIVVLSVIDLVCVGAIFYLLFSAATLSAALASVLLPTIVGVAAAFLIGKLSSPVDVSAPAAGQDSETLRRSA